MWIVQVYWTGEEWFRTRDKKEALEYFEEMTTNPDFNDRSWALIFTPENGY